MDMIIKGIGNDIIAIDRIKQAINRRESALINRLFSKAEQTYCSKFKDPLPHYAARFAAKEAVVKALGTGFRSIKWTDIQIINNNSGKPTVKLSTALKKRFKNPSILISLSHCKSYASAVAIWL